MGKHSIFTNLKRVEQDSIKIMLSSYLVHQSERENKMNDVVLTSFATATFTVACTYGFDRYKNFKSTNMKRLSILNALSAELSTLKTLIEDRKKGFEMTKVSFPSSTLAYIPISFNYFSVFDNLSAEFGLLNNPQVVQLIISTYAEIKGLFDNVKDLGNSARFLQKLSVTPGIETKVVTQLRNNQEQMLYVLLTEQVPMVLQLIDACIQKICKEKVTIQEANGVKGFCKYVFYYTKEQTVL